MATLAKTKTKWNFGCIWSCVYLKVYSLQCVCVLLSCVWVCWLVDSQEIADAPGACGAGSSLLPTGRSPWREWNTARSLYCGKQLPCKTKHILRESTQRWYVHWKLVFSLLFLNMWQHTRLLCQFCTFKTPEYILESKTCLLDSQCMDLQWSPRPLQSSFRGFMS